MTVPQTDNFIYHNKLNRLILANQSLYRLDQATKGPKQKICPICQGENSQCQYFEPLKNEGFESKALAESLTTPETVQTVRFTRLSNIKDRLTGHMVTVSDYDDEYTLDLGKSLNIAEHSINLYQPLEEMPLLQEIVKWLKLDKNNQQPLSQVPFPSLVLQTEAFNLLNLDEESRELINQTILEELAQQNVQVSWEWVPVLLNGKEIIDRPEGQTAYDAIELLEKAAFCRCQELLYSYYAEAEEKFLAQMNAKNVDERKYPCGDYQNCRETIVKILSEARKAIVICI